MTWYWYALAYAACAILLALILGAVLRERARVQQETERYRRQIRATRQLTEATEAARFRRRLIDERVNETLGDLLSNDPPRVHYAKKARASASSL